MKPEQPTPTQRVEQFYALKSTRMGKELALQLAAELEAAQKESKEWQTQNSKNCLDYENLRSQLAAKTR